MDFWGKRNFSQSDFFHKWNLLTAIERDLFFVSKVKIHGGKKNLVNEDRKSLPKEILFEKEEKLEKMCQKNLKNQEEDNELVWLLGCLWEFLGNFIALWNLSEILVWRLQSSMKIYKCCKKLFWNHSQSPKMYILKKKCLEAFSSLTCEHFIRVKSY